MKKTAFVTGGTGFLGTNLIEKLVSEGWDVTALHRPTSNLKYIKPLTIKLVEGDIQDKALLEKVIPMNLDAVFHVAGDVSAWKKLNAAQTLTNVNGSRNMVEVAAAKKAKCFVHTSSISAWGKVQGLTNEETPQQGEVSWSNYEKTKWQGEQEALKGVDLGMKVVVMNPAIILGRYDKDSWGQAFIALHKSELPFVASGCSCFIHVQEVVKAHIAAVEKGQNGHKYILGGENVSFPVFMGEVAHVLGKKPPKIISSFLFKGIGWLSGMIANITNKPPLISPEIAEGITRQDYRFSSEKAQRELDLKIIPFKVGVKDCYDWLRQEGFLD